MSPSLLSQPYASNFVDDAKYWGRPSIHLAGLACAIQDSHPTWRPPISELILLLPKSEKSNAIVAAGMAYGAAKQISADFPGPAILLYGTALNTIGSAPNVELQTSIDDAIRILEEHGLRDKKEITSLVRAAKERASFDKVSQMLRNEFSEGLRASGRYNDDIINEVVTKIVSVTHDVRHRGLIERITWKNIVVEEGGSSTSIGWLHEIDEVIFADDLLRELVEFAQVGCAFRILNQFGDFSARDSA